MAYNVAHTVEYASSNDQFFIPGNCQAPTNSHDNPDNGTAAERAAACLKTSPAGSAVDS